MGKELTQAERRYDELLLALYALQFKRPDYVTLAVFGEVTSSVIVLASAYYYIALQLGLEVQVGRFHRPSKPREKGKSLDQTHITHPEQFLAEPPDKVLGVSLALTGSMAYPRFELERGTHEFVEQKKKHYCLVKASELAIDKYVPPSGIDRMGVITSRNIKRSYDMHRKTIDEKTLGREFRWSGRDIASVLRDIIEQNLSVTVSSLVKM